MEYSDRIDFIYPEALNQIKKIMSGEIDIPGEFRGRKYDVKYFGRKALEQIQSVIPTPGELPLLPFDGTYNVVAIINDVTSVDPQHNFEILLHEVLNEGKAVEIEDTLSTNLKAYYQQEGSEDLPVTILFYSGQLIQKEPQVPYVKGDKVTSEQFIPFMLKQVDLAHFRGFAYDVYAYTDTMGVHDCTIQTHHETLTSKLSLVCYTKGLVQSETAFAKQSFMVKYRIGGNNLIAVRLV